LEHNKKLGEQMKITEKEQLAMDLENAMEDQFAQESRKKEQMKEIRKIETEKHDDWVCNWCGSEDVYEIAYIPMNFFPKDYSEIRYPKNDEYISDCCGDFEYPLTQFEWEEKVAEETMGNKEEYHKILDGSRL